MTKYVASTYARTMGLRPGQYRRRPRKVRAAIKKSARPRMGARVRIGAPTKTQFKKKLFGSGRKTGENSSMSYCKTGRPWMSRYMMQLYKKVQSRQVDSKVSVGNATSSTGLQQIFFQSSLLPADLTRMKTLAAGGTATANTVRFFIGHVKRKMCIRNQTNTVAKVSIYDMVYKRNPMDNAFDSPVELWSKGYTDMGRTNQHLQVHTTPFKSPEFNRYISVKKVTVMHLEAGQQHEHTFIHRVNRVIDSTEFDNASNISAIGGLTSTTMIVFHGSLGHDKAAPATVTYIPITLDWTLHSEASFGIISRNTPSYEYDGTIPTTVTDMDFMGDADDVER